MGLGNKTTIVLLFWMLLTRYYMANTICDITTKCGFSCTIQSMTHCAHYNDEKNLSYVFQSLDVGSPFLAYSPQPTRFPPRWTKSHLGCFSHGQNLFEKARTIHIRTHSLCWQTILTQFGRLFQAMIWDDNYSQISSILTFRL